MNNKQNRELDNILRKQASKQASLIVGLFRPHGWPRGLEK